MHGICEAQHNFSQRALRQADSETRGWVAANNEPFSEHLVSFVLSSRLKIKTALHGKTNFALSWHHSLLSTGSSIHKHTILIAPATLSVREAMPEGISRRHEL